MSVSRARSETTYYANNDSGNLEAEDDDDGKKSFYDVQSRSIMAGE